MISKDLTTLKINKLTKAQYEAAKTAGTLSEEELYMTPSEGATVPGLTPSETIPDVAEMLMTQSIFFVDNEGMPTSGSICTSSDNSGMSLTGVVSDPTDPTSAANIEYIQAMTREYQLGKYFFADSSDGIAYTITDENDELPSLFDIGDTIYVLPNKTSTSAEPTLDVKGTGAKPIKRMYSTGQDIYTKLANTATFHSGIPVHLTYTDSAWVLREYPKPVAGDLNGVVPISKGGSGASNVNQAKVNLGIPTITYGTTDLVAGTSELAEGTFYFVYE